MFKDNFERPLFCPLSTKSPDGIGRPPLNGVNTTNEVRPRKLNYTFACKLHTYTGC